MPVTTSGTTLAVAIASKRTKTSKRLDFLFRAANLLSLKDDTHYGAFQTAGHLNALDAPCQAILNLSGPEVQHIDAWDSTQKESVRSALVTAIETNRAVSFFWEVAPIPIEETIIVFPGSGNITVTFRTPAAFIDEVEGEVQVGVGAPP